MTRMSANRPLDDGRRAHPGRRRPPGRRARDACGAGCGWCRSCAAASGGTLLLALIATGGRVVVPIAVQQTLDRGLLAAGGPDLGRVAWIVAGCAGVVLVTAVCGVPDERPAVPVSETALAALRIRAFRHVHDLSMLHQQAERRGSLVSRVTSDVDQISVFMQWGGILVVTSPASCCSPPC